MICFLMKLHQHFASLLLLNPKESLCVRKEMLLKLELLMLFDSTVERPTLGKETSAAASA